MEQQPETNIISHESFEINARFELWIEKKFGKYLVLHQLKTAGQAPCCVGQYSDMIEAVAHKEAIKTLFSPHIVEGSEVDVRELTKGTTTK